MSKIAQSFHNSQKRRTPDIRHLQKIARRQITSNVLPVQLNADNIFACQEKQTLSKQKLFHDIEDWISLSDVNELLTNGYPCNFSILMK